MAKRPGMNVTDVAPQHERQGPPVDAGIDVAHTEESKEPLGTVERIDAPIQISKVAIQDIRPCATNPRKVFGDLSDMVKNIGQLGIIHPLIARRIEGGHLELVCGERRLRAAKEAGLTHVPVDVRTLNDAQALQMQMAENLERATLHPLEEAEGLSRLHKQYGQSAEDISRTVGKSPRWVHTRLQLMSLGPEARKALTNERVDVSTAILLASIPSHKLQADALEKVAGVEGERPSYREAKDYLQQNFTTELRGVAFDKKDPYLVPEAGACATCPKRTGNSPDLFDTKRADVCTDIQCFQAKMAAHWDLEKQKAKQKGMKAVGLAEGRKIFKNGTPSADSEFVDIDAPCARDAKKRSWREVLGDKVMKSDKVPTITVAPDSDGNTHQLMARDEALVAAREAGVKWAAGEVKDAQASKRLSKEDQAKQEAEEAVQKEIENEVLDRAVKAVEKEGLAAPALRMMAMGLTQVYRADVMTRREFNTERDMEAFIESASAAKLTGLVFELSVMDWIRGHNGLSNELGAMAKALKINVSEIEKAERQTLEAEALFDKKKSKK